MSPRRPFRGSAPIKFPLQFAAAVPRKFRTAAASILVTRNGRGFWAYQWRDGALDPFEGDWAVLKTCRRHKRAEHVEEFAVQRRAGYRRRAPRHRE